jgi:hypothetical protein
METQFCALYQLRRRQEQVIKLASDSNIARCSHALICTSGVASGDVSCTHVCADLAIDTQG